MFSKLKQVKDLRSQAKTMQNALADETITIEKKGITLEMNGNMEIQKININDNLSKEKMENVLKDIFNDAVKKTQRIMAKKMQEMGGFPGLG